MEWHYTVNKQIPEAVMVPLTDAHMHHQLSSG